MRARREARMVPACPPCTNRRSAPTPCLFSAALLCARRTRRSTAMCQGILQQPDQTQSMRGLSSGAGSGIHICYVHAQAQLTASTTAVLQISMFRATRLQFQMQAVPFRAMPLPPEELVSPSIMLSIIGFGSCIFAGHILAHYELEDCSNSICRSQNSLIVMDVLGERRVHG